jgi:hypothetical protein
VNSTTAEQRDQIVEASQPVGREDGELPDRVSASYLSCVCSHKFVRYIAKLFHGYAGSRSLPQRCNHVMT